jgi:hypothetical protein
MTRTKTRSKLGQVDSILRILKMVKIIVVVNSRGEQKNWKTD